MANVAKNLIRSLGGSQWEKAVFEYDDPYRVHWDFLPMAMIGRKGVALTALSELSPRLAYELLESCVS